MGAGGRLPPSLRAKRTNCRSRRDCWAACPTCPAGSLVTGASPPTPSAIAFGTWVCVRGAHPAILPKRTDAPVACPDWVYVNRRLVENLWACLKEWRAVATRYEKTARFFLGILCL